MSNNKQCQFEASRQTSSATICKWCGREKWQHNTTMNNKQSSLEWLVSQINVARKLCDDQSMEMDIWHTLDVLIKKGEQAKEMHKQEIYQHAINFYLFVENDEVTDQKVEIIVNLYKDYLKEFYNETFGK